MTTTTESEMMSQCCGADGTFDFEHMRAFMGRCGKVEFTDAEIAAMRRFCSDHREMCEKMKLFMKSCGCTCGSPDDE